jgi:hypothetical protein
MSLLLRVRRSLWVGLATVVVAFTVPVLSLLATAPPAGASTTQLSMFEVPGLATAAQDPARTLQTLRSLGVNLLRVGVYWNEIAPSPTSRTRPFFNAADPSAYPAANWAGLDRLVSEAQTDGIQIDFMVTGGAPLWATQTGAPLCPTGAGGCYESGFEPSASEYGQFVQAVATRYRSVHFWEIWNESNWGPSLTPQYSNSSVPVSAYIYRGLLGAGWNALQATGHGGDTIVATSLSQDGSGNQSETGTTAPLIFIRTLYCADSSYHHLAGAAASEAGCPTTTAGYQQFKAANPALFGASGVGVHPYPYGGPPTHADFPSPDGLEFPEIPQLTTTLDQLQRLYIPSGSFKQMAAYNTEYGYRTRPNDTKPFFTTPDNAATYINQAEYLSWKNPRIATYDQYELDDGGGWFPTGLYFAAQTTACPGTVPCPKPSFYSYRLPVWLPVTAIPQGHTAEVWGHARPASFARLDTGLPQNVLIQWAPGTSGQFQTVTTTQASALGFVDTQVKFPGNGQVRLAWQYPPGDSRLSDPLDPSPWIYSRVTNVTFYKHTATGYLRGVSKGHLTLGLTVKAGSGAPPITSVTVRPPHALKLRCSRVKKTCKGLDVHGAKVKRATVTHGKLVLTLVHAAAKVSITAVAPFVKLRKRTTKTMKFSLVVVDTNGAQSTIPLKLKPK